MAKLGLEYVAIIDNDTNNTVDGQPPGTIQVIVKGGTPSEIAQAIYQEKGTGIRTYGTTQQNVTDSKGYTKTIRFSRPVDTPIYVVVNVKRLKGSSNETHAMVKTACVDFINNTKIGAEIVWSELVSYITDQVNLISIKSLYLGRSANPTSTEDIDLTSIEKSIASASGVLVNVLT